MVQVRPKLSRRVLLIMTSRPTRARLVFLAAANAEQHALKRTYLTLLPHTQLVELCLAFEAYSPLHVKESLWPSNLAAAVDKL